MTTEYRVVYTQKFHCNCPACPDKNDHQIGPRVYDTTTDVNDVDRIVNKAWNVDQVADVLVEQREITEWKLSGSA